MSKYRYQFTNEQLNNFDNLNRDAMFGQVMQIGEPLIVEDDDQTQPTQIGDQIKQYQIAGDTKTALNMAAFQNAVNEDQQNYNPFNRQQIENKYKKERLQKGEIGISMQEKQYSAFNPQKDIKADFNNVIKYKADIDNFKVEATKFFDRNNADVRAPKPIDAGYFLSVNPEVETYKKKISDIMTKSDYIKRYFTPKDKNELQQKRLQPTINTRGQQIFNPILPRQPTQIPQQAVSSNNISVIFNQRNNVCNSNYVNKLEQVMVQKNNHDIYNLQNNNNFATDRNDVNRPKQQLSTHNSYSGMNVQRNQVPVNNSIQKKLNPGQQMSVPPQNVILNRQFNNNYISTGIVPTKPTNTFQLTNTKFKQDMSLYSNLQNNDRLYGNGSLLPDMPPNFEEED